MARASDVLLAYDSGFTGFTINDQMETGAVLGGASDPESSPDQYYEDFTARLANFTSMYPRLVQIPQATILTGFRDDSDDDDDSDDSDDSGGSGGTLLTDYIVEGGHGPGRRDNIAPGDDGADYYGGDADGGDAHGGDAHGGDAHGGDMDETKPALVYSASKTASASSSVSSMSPPCASPPCASPPCASPPSASPP